MGKRYYCDYCDKTMSCAVSIIKTHNSGLVHQKLVNEHYQKFKDPETILAEESKKIPCNRFFKGECKFGSICRYSHYPREQLESLKHYLHVKKVAETVETQLCLKDLYKKLQQEKSLKSHDDGNTVLVEDTGVTHILPWTYNPVLETYGNLPPSIKKFKVEDFTKASFARWA